MTEIGEATLFVGGPWDGRREVVGNYGRHFTVPMFHGCSYDGKTTRVENAHYERKVFNANGKQFYFRVVSGMTEAELMDRLIRGYRPANEETK